MQVRREARPVAGRRWGRARTAADATGHQQSTVFVSGRPVGRVVGEAFVKTVAASRHMLRRPEAWCLDTQSLEDARRLGATMVELHDQDTGRTFEASLEVIRRDGIPLDRGFGPQLALPLHRWAMRDSRQLALFGA